MLLLLGRTHWGVLGRIPQVLCLFIDPSWEAQGEEEKEREEKQEGEEKQAGSSWE
jgi:hypothetical protein